MRRPAFTVIALVALALPLAAQAPPRDARAKSPVTLAGRVVADDSDTPIPNARVGVTPAVPGAALTLTDAEGRFSLATTSSRVTLTIARTGYATTEVTAAAGAPLDIRVTRSAAIAGRVVDEFGEPATNTSVRLHSTSGPSIRRGVQTDDRGEYRFGGLPAGTYVVSPQRPDPSGRSADDGAQVVMLQPGDVAPEVDFLVRPDRLSDRLFLVPPSAAAAAAPVPIGSATVRGIVSSTDGRPIPHASVALRPPPRSQIAVREAFADENGRFAFADLPAGTYTVMAIKGWPAGLLSVPTKTVTVENGGIAEADVSIALQNAAIEGVVTDEDGDPLQGITVQALEIRYDRGARRLVPSWSSRVTDDRGRYRLFGLPAGAYVVSATPGATSGAAGTELPGYARSFYPGTTNPSQAQMLAVTGGDTVGGVNLSVVRGRTARVAGRLLDAAGQPTSGGSVMLVPSVRSGAAVTIPLGARIGEDGAFEFTSVPPGQYVVQADRGRKGASTEGDFGSALVDVSDSDVTGVVVQSMPGSSVGGRIVLDSASGRKLESLSDLEIRPVPVDFDFAPRQVATADVQEDGRFLMRGITGVRRIEAPRVPLGWMLKEVRAGGIDVTDRPIEFGRREQSRNDVEIVLTDRVSGVGGTVTDDRNAPVASAPVIVFPTDRTLRYFASRYLAKATTSETGTFNVSSLPPGSYYVTAIVPLRDNDADGWQDPQFLESLARVAQSVIVRGGETTTINLRQSAP